MTNTKTLPVILCALIAMITTSSVRAFDHSHAELNKVLKKFVNTEGMVDYPGLKAYRSSLDNYLTKTGAIGEPEFNAWTRDQRLAFLINVYNAETLQLIIDNYPVKSIKKIPSINDSQEILKDLQMVWW